MLVSSLLVCRGRLPGVFVVPKLARIEPLLNLLLVHQQLAVHLFVNVSLDLPRHNLGLRFLRGVGGYRL